jgi:hypothetical protein
LDFNGVTAVGGTFQEHLADLQKGAVQKSQLAAESRELSALSEGSPVPSACCVA